MRARRIASIVGSPFLLLVVCGFLFASKVMISKGALQAGIQPVQLGIIVNLGAGLLLYPMLRKAGGTIPRTSRHLILFLVLGIVSFAVPTVMSYFLVQQVGPAYTATVYSLSPLLTMTFAAVVGIEKMYLTRFSGILIGFLGMITLVQQQVREIDLGQSFWVMLGLLVPASAALGNIIRSACWPKGASALAFSCGTLFSSSIVLAVLSPWIEPPTQWLVPNATIIFWFAFLIIVSAVSSVLNFRLQQVGGAVVFSQLGYWGTGFGVLLAALIFGDVLTLISLAGVCCIIVGGLLSRRSEPLLVTRN